MKFKLPKRRIWRVAIYIVSTLLVLLAIDLIAVQVGRHITPGYETTRITSPTYRDGRIDYLTAIETRLSQGVTSENNAVPLVLEALGREALPVNQPADGITARLGMPPLPASGDYFQVSDVTSLPATAPSTQATKPAKEVPSLDDIIESFKASDAERERVWTAPPNPKVIEWINANEKPLAKLLEASKRPRWFMPFNGGTPPEDLLQIQLPYLRSIKNAARALVARAMLKAGQGDISGARQDLMAVHQLADLLGQGATIIDRLVGYVIDGVASSGEMSLAANGKIDAAQARAWIAELGKLPPIAGISDCMDAGERYMYLDIMQVSARKGLGHLMQVFQMGAANSPYEMGRPFWPFIPMQYGRSMRVANNWYDRMVVASGKPTAQDRRTALRDVQKDFEAFVAQTRPWHVLTRSDWPVAAFTPALFRINERTDLAQAKRNLSIVALALAAYRAERGSSPATLDALGPLVAKVPADPFGSAFIYRPSKSGFVLYSVGPNETDDGGKGDDLIVQMGS